MKTRILFFLTAFLLLAISVGWAQNPQINSPADGATVNPCGFNMAIQGTSANTRRLEIIVLDDQGAPIESIPILFRVRTALTAQTSVTIAIPALPAGNADYIIAVFAYSTISNNPANIIGDNAIVVTASSSPTGSTPAVTFPTNNATGVSVTPTVTVAAYTGCGNLTRATIELDRSPANWVNPDFQTTIINNNNGPFSFTPSTALDYGTEYQIRVVFQNNLGQSIDTTITSFTTQTPVVPTITSPVAGSTVSSCGFNVAVSAITPPPSDGRTYRVAVQYKQSADPVSAYSANTLSQPLNGSSADFGPYTVAIPAGVLQGGTAYDFRALYQVFDPAANGGLGGFVAYGAFSPVTTVTTDVTDANPVVTLPVNGATGVSVTPTITVAAYAGCGTLTSATIEVDLGSPGTPADWVNDNFQSTVFSSGPFSFALPVELDYGTSYQIRVRFVNTANQVFTTITSFTTLPITPTNPLLNSPVDGSPALSLCSDVVLNMNANNVAAKNLQVKVILNGNPNVGIFDSTYVFTSTAQRTTAFNVTLPRTLFASGANYNVELTSRANTNQGTFIGRIYPGFLTDTSASTAANTPVITFPADASTGNAFTPTIQIQSPFAGCTLTSVVYEILLGTVGNTIVSSQSYTTPTYAWTVPVFLTAGATYRAKVTYNTSVGAFSDTNVFTVSPTPGVSISSPLVLTNLDPCGFPVTVSPYPNATTVQVEYKLAAAATYSVFYSAPVIASTTMFFAFDSTRLQSVENYDLRLTAGTFVMGVFTPISGSVAAFNFSTGNISGNLTPTLAAPANAASGVSLTPTITFDAYQGNCGSVTSYVVTIVPVGDAFDTPSPNRVFESSPTNGFVLGTSLLSNTTYKIRISTIITINGKQTFAGSYGDGSYTFTTTGPVLSPTQITNVADDTYLNTFTQNFSAASVTGANQYQWQFSETSDFSGAIIAKTSVTPLLVFQADEAGFVSGARYFVRVRGVNTTSGQAGVFAIDAASVLSYYHPLFRPFATSPTGLGVNRRRFVLKSTVPANATHVFFQLVRASDANDATPLNDFTLANTFTNTIPYYQNTTYSLSGASSVQATPVIPDPVFQANGFFQRNWGVEATVNYVQAQPQTKYRIRVVAARLVNGVFVQQSELANAPINTFATFGIPNRNHVILNIANGQTNVNNIESINLTRVVVSGAALDWDITNYQTQVATSFDFSSGLIALPNDATFTGTGTVGSVTEGNPVFFVPDLAFSTTYYVRTRSTATVNGSPSISAWGPVVQFTTRSAPTGRAGSAQGASFDEIASIGYPNPFEGEISIRISRTHGIVKVKVKNLMGQTMDTFQATGGTTLQLGKNYGRGMYIVSIEEQDNNEVLRIVKQ